MDDRPPVPRSVLVAAAILLVSIPIALIVALAVRGPTRDATVGGESIAVEPVSQGRGDRPTATTAPRTGTIVLPAGAKTAPSDLVVATSESETRPAADGSFQVSSRASYPHLHAAIDASGSAVLMAVRPTHLPADTGFRLDALSTATALVYLNPFVAQPTAAAADKALETIRQLPETRRLADYLDAALAEGGLPDPAGDKKLAQLTGKAISAFIQQLPQAQSHAALPSAGYRSALAPVSVICGQTPSLRPTNALTVSPSGKQAGVRLVAETTTPLASTPFRLENHGVAWCCVEAPANRASPFYLRSRAPTLSLSLGGPHSATLSLDLIAHDTTTVTVWVPGLRPFRPPGLDPRDYAKISQGMVITLLADGLFPVLSCLLGVAIDTSDDMVVHVAGAILSSVAMESFTTGLARISQGNIAVGLVEVLVDMAKRIILDREVLKKVVEALAAEIGAHARQQLLRAAAERMATYLAPVIGQALLIAKVGALSAGLIERAWGVATTPSAKVVFTVTTSGQARPDEPGKLTGLRIHLVSRFESEFERGENRPVCDIVGVCEGDIMVYAPRSSCDAESRSAYAGRWHMLDDIANTVKLGPTNRYVLVRDRRPLISNAKGHGWDYCYGNLEPVGVTGEVAAAARRLIEKASKEHVHAQGEPFEVQDPEPGARPLDLGVFPDDPLVADYFGSPEPRVEHHDDGLVEYHYAASVQLTFYEDARLMSKRASGWLDDHVTALKKRGFELENRWDEECGGPWVSWKVELVQSPPAGSGIRHPNCVSRHAAVEFFCGDITRLSRSYSEVCRPR
jgi:hypothetical protein